MIECPKNPKFDFAEKGPLKQSLIETSNSIISDGTPVPNEVNVDEVDLSSQALAYQEATASISSSSFVSSTKNTLREFTVNGRKGHVINTPYPVEKYAQRIIDDKLYQKAGFQTNDCLLLSQYFAVDLLRGKKTPKHMIKNHEGAPAPRINNTVASKNPDEIWKFCYDEINKGHPVVLQVSQVEKGSRHVVTVVGYTDDVTCWEDLNPSNTIVLDCYDGKIQILGLSREEGGHERSLFPRDKEGYQAKGPTEACLKEAATIESELRAKNLIP